jgi:lipoate-protein ligase A
VDPLRSQTGLPRDEIIDRMLDVFVQRHGGAPAELDEAAYAAAERLVAEKFSTEAWIRRVP